MARKTLKCDFCSFLSVTELNSVPVDPRLSHNHWQFDKIDANRDKTTIYLGQNVFKDSPEDAAAFGLKRDFPKLANFDGSPEHEVGNVVISLQDNDDLFNNELINRYKILDLRCCK